MIGIVGAGAFGTALAVTLARGGARVALWTRDPDRRAMLRQKRESQHLAGVRLDERITITDAVADLRASDAILIALPAQVLRAFLAGPGRPLLASPLIACCKGIDLVTLRGPVEVMRAAGARGVTGILSGPGFAADIARGLPTALTLACHGADGVELQERLSTPTLRLYRTQDVIGVELGGALKNVIAIAAGAVIGGGLGDSARAALVARGQAEISRLALALGARAETLGGLSGLGDLILTCTSEQSRNFRHGMALAQSEVPPRATVEGVATATAALHLGERHGLDLPIARMVTRLVAGDIAVPEALQEFMERPLKEE